MDLVLISQSAEGLENALSILSEYCEHWLLSVNPKKIKIMTVSRRNIGSRVLINVVFISMGTT